MSFKIKNLSFSINGKHLVFIPEWYQEAGTIYGLCGDTGSGKSTIGRWLANVEPVYWNVEGDLEYDLDSEDNFDKESIDSGILKSQPPLYLLQDAYQIFNPYVPILTHFMDVWKNHSGQSGIGSFNEIIDILIEIGINDPRSLLSRKVHQVSQGEAQRMAFVLGLIRPASIRIYDEVFSNVDEEASKAMLTYLRKYCNKTTSSAIVISHETTFFGEFVDEMYIIQKGILKTTELPVVKPSPHKTNVDFVPFIEIKDMVLPPYVSTKNGKNELWRLSDFSIGRMESVGLIGESGVGKTTFLRSLLGEHSLIWTECRISMKNSSHQETELSTLDIRYLPQSVVSAFNPAYPIKTTLQELKTAYQVDHVELLSLLERFGLKNLHLEKYPNELSGGEIQRIGIISVLIGNPDLILLDESFSSVDQATREIIWDILMKEQQDKLFSLLIVSHDISWLRDRVNRIYEMEYQ